MPEASCLCGVNRVSITPTPVLKEVQMPLHHLGVRFAVDNRRSVEELGIKYRPLPPARARCTTPASSSWPKCVLAATDVISAASLRVVVHHLWPEHLVRPRMCSEGRRYAIVQDSRMVLVVEGSWLFGLMLVDGKVLGAWGRIKGRGLQLSCLV